MAKGGFAFLAIAAALVLGSCGSSSTPTDQTDACSVLRQKRGWTRDLAEVEQKWGVPANVVMATIWKESSYQSRAKTRRTYFLGIIPTGRVSSAYGYAQAIDGTWDWYRKETGNRFADRDDFDDAVDFIGWYMHTSARKLGIPEWDAYNQYLAYHEGHTGFRKGTHMQKTWLLNTAAEVDAMSKRYQSQLLSCT